MTKKSSYPKVKQRKKMSSYFSSSEFHFNQVSPFYMISELSQENWFSLAWIKNSDTKENTFRSLLGLKCTVCEMTQTPALSFIIFGELSWEKIWSFEQLCKQLGSEVSAVQAIKPTEKLEGALKFVLNNETSKQQIAAIIQWAESQQLECCNVDKAPSLSQPGLLVMDMDSTAIEIECIDEIAKLAGVGEQVAEVTAAAMRGELDFAESLRARVATLTNAPVSIIDEVANNLPLMPGLVELVKTLQQHNWKLVVASGGFTYMTDVLKQQLQLDKTVANQLEMADGKLTGQVLGQIVDAQVKADTVIELAHEFNIPLSQTVAMGDGANDLLMMDAAQLGVAFHAKPLVREKADAAVNNGGLDQLLYLLQL